MANNILAMIGAIVIFAAGAAGVISLVVLFTQGFLAILQIRKLK